MSDFLQKMAKLSAERASAARPPAAADLDRPVIPLRLGAFDIIAEIKARSPAEGELAAPDLARGELATKYVDGGAAAISVLTEPSRFDGSLGHLDEVVAAVPGTPVMRKDFLVAPVQLLEARAAGASGVLLIAALLADRKLREMLDCAYEYELFVLLECFDEDDLGRVSALLDESPYGDVAMRGSLLVGINTRNLRTLQVDAGRLQKLAPALPRARCVAESGLADVGDAATVAGLGYTLALVGTALMRSDDPAALIRGMRAAGTARIAA